eukprot:scaffold3095_cov130-Amphora_coffeaeformis.AAC.2
MHDLSTGNNRFKMEEGWVVDPFKWRVDDDIPRQVPSPVRTLHDMGLGHQPMRYFFFFGRDRQREKKRPPDVLDILRRSNGRHEARDMGSTCRNTGEIGIHLHFVARKSPTEYLRFDKRALGKLKVGSLFPKSISLWVYTSTSHHLIHSTSQFSFCAIAYKHDFISHRVQIVKDCRSRNAPY